MTATHPDQKTLAAFGLGRLSDSERDVVETHVSDCAECCRELEKVNPDSLVGLARAAMATPSPNEGDTLPPDPADALRGHLRYRVLGLLGAGGMGTVYKAEHRLMRRMVALKVLAPRLVSSPSALDRFRREVRLASRLTHPNIVTVHDADEACGMHFLVMEHIQGVSLDRLVARKGPLPIANACQMIRLAAAGLQHAADHGMVHRDIKPHNLMVTRQGQLKILDFGLARLAQAADGSRAEVSQTLTTPGLMLGTPDFVAPEQARNPAAADIRADLYSLGCTLYYLLAGRVPFPGDTAIAKMIAHSEDTPTPVNELRPEVPQGLADVIARLMAKKPADRYQTPTEVAGALKPFARGEAGVSVADVVDVTESLPIARPPAPRGPNRRMWLAGGGAALLLAAAGAAVVAFFPRGDSPPSSAASGSPGTTPPSTPRVLLVVPSVGFSRPEYNAVRQQLQKAGCQVGVASTARGVARPENEAWSNTMPVEWAIDGVRSTDWDAVVVVGGTGASMLLNHNQPHGPATTKLLREFADASKVVAGMGHASCVLADAGVLDGKRATGSSYVRQKKPKGTTWEDVPVVADGKRVTARDESAAEPFVNAVLAGVRTAR